ncbi:hypothetical protein C5E45_34140 [Nocardia nova]|uniref:Uncharacterized protein n=1 Tax=Nocardia nova TaxID=37330 RepID=A0A2S6A8Q4_9NOCA|nr:hypothetical protein C5E45_34140 [Nocardia nova]
MKNVPFSRSWYWLRPDGRTACCGVVIIVFVVVLGSVIGYGQAAISAFITAVVSTAATTMVESMLRAWAYRA